MLTASYIVGALFLGGTFYSRGVHFHKRSGGGIYSVFYSTTPFVTSNNHPVLTTSEIQFRKHFTEHTTRRNIK